MAKKPNDEQAQVELAEEEAVREAAARAAELERVRAEEHKRRHAGLVLSQEDLFKKIDLLKECLRDGLSAASEDASRIAYIDEFHRDASAKIDEMVAWVNRHSMAS